MALMAEVCSTAENLAETAAVADAEMNAALAQASAQRSPNSKHKATTPQAEA
jgi:hypothetical protein